MSPISSPASVSRLQDAVRAAMDEVLVSVLGGLDPGGLSPAEQIDFLVLTERMKAHLDARQMVVLAVMDSADSSEQHCVIEEVRAALRLPVATARRRLDTARMLGAHLPGTLARLDEGAITLRHAEVIVEAAQRLGRDELDRDDLDGAGRFAQLEEIVLRRANDQSPSDLRRSRTGPCSVWTPTAGTIATPGPSSCAGSNAPPSTTAWPNYA